MKHWRRGQTNPRTKFWDNKDRERTLMKQKNTEKVEGKKYIEII